MNEVEILARVDGNKISGITLPTFLRRNAVTNEQQYTRYKYDSTEFNAIFFAKEHTKCL
jgi:hypothetical protein